MSDPGSIHYEFTLFSAKLAIDVIDCIFSYDPTVFDGDTGEHLNVRLQEIIGKAAAEFYSEMKHAEF
jgi:hypothetical protein